jgi:hypothetical protein
MANYLYHLQQEVLDRIPSGIFFHADQLQHGPDLSKVYEKGIDPLHFPYFRREDSGYSSTTDNYSVPGPQGGNQDGGQIRCLPLLDVNIDVDIQSTLAKTLVTQSFTNLSSSSIKEANYSFPLYDGATIIAFRCHIGDERVLDGVVKPTGVD